MSGTILPFFAVVLFTVVKTTWTIAAYKFQLNAAINGKTCPGDRLAFSKGSISSAVRCGALCAGNGDCASHFYSKTGGRCDGCTLTYIDTDLGSLAGTLDGSMYYRPNKEYMGCYDDCNNDCHLAGRALKTHCTTDFNLSPRMCNDCCRDLGYVYYGCENSIYCFCGDSTYDRYGEEKDACIRTFPANDQYQCGSGRKVAVYRVVSDLSRK